MIVTYPNIILDNVCDDVTEFGSELRQLIDDMSEIMYASNGIGLAAPQIGVSKNVILADPTGGESDNNLTIMINPKILSSSAQTEIAIEGCLSLPGIFLSISRPIHVTIEYSDIDGKICHKACSNLLARIVQHEIEHLQGIMMLNKVGQLTKKMTLKKLL